MNHIEKLRANIKAHFNPERKAENSEEVYISPSGKYKLCTSRFSQDKKDVNWVVTQVEIIEIETERLMFHFFGNYVCFYHAWLQKGEIEYLICAEDLYGGQTVIDLRNEKMEGYSPNEDGFIWTEFYLSPDGSKIAIMGCYWACPYVLKLYDFSEPMILPLKELREIELIDNCEIVLGWIDDETLKSEGDETIEENEVVGDVPLERHYLREIKIDGSSTVVYV